MTTQPLRIGIAGLGTVGSGVVRILQRHAGMIATRAGRPIAITAISARDRHRNRDLDLSAYAWEDDPVALARKVIDRGLSVRNTEALVRTASQPKPPRPPRSSEKDADTRALEGDLSAHLKMRVSIDASGQGGKVTISWRDLDQLDRLIQILGAG